MLEESFDGKNPIVYQIGYDGGYTFLAGKGIHKKSLGQHSNLREVTAQFSHDRISAGMSTDNWPFFYMPVRKFPSSYIVMILLLLGLSVVFIRKFTPKTNLGFSFPCFFLGAGFMLIETKGITELAFVYGSTWIVISIVIAFILLMAFLANLFVIRIGNPSIFAT